VTGKSLTPERYTTEMFAQVFRAFLEASGEVQEVIKSMVRVVNDPQVDDDDREAAIETLMEALFPASHEGELGIDLDDVQQVERSGYTEASRSIALEEQAFANNLRHVMETRGVTQQQLAERIGVGQPAISMMLARECRPQRRTVERIAEALGVSADELWNDRG
jgi:lambda repressor-like predicted transcriptional regulator